MADLRADIRVESQGFSQLNRQLDNVEQSTNEINSNMSRFNQLAKVGAGAVAGIGVGFGALVTSSLDNFQLFREAQAEFGFESVQTVGRAGNIYGRFFGDIERGFDIAGDSLNEFRSRIGEAVGGQLGADLQSILESADIDIRQFVGLSDLELQIRQLEIIEQLTLRLGRAQATFVAERLAGETAGRFLESQVNQAIRDGVSIREVVLDAQRRTVIVNEEVANSLSGLTARQVDANQVLELYKANLVSVAESLLPDSIDGYAAALSDVLIPRLIEAATQAATLSVTLRAVGLTSGFGIGSLGGALFSARGLGIAGLGIGAIAGGGYLASRFLGNRDEQSSRQVTQNLYVDRVNVNSQNPDSWIEQTLLDVYTRGNEDLSR